MTDHYIGTIPTRFYADDFVPSGGGAKIYFSRDGLPVTVSIVPGQLAVIACITGTGDAGLIDPTVLATGGSPDPVFAYLSAQSNSNVFKVGLGGFTGDGTYQVRNLNTYGPFMVIVGALGVFSH